MDCDGLKKAILNDLDGSFLGGSQGAIIPQSEWQWDGDRRRGLGDYRIPKVMLTKLNGDRIPVKDIAPNKGQCIFYYVSMVTIPDYYSTLSLAMRSFNTSWALKLLSVQSLFYINSLC